MTTMKTYVTKLNSTTSTQSKPATESQPHRRIDDTITLQPVITSKKTEKIPTSSALGILMSFITSA
jgi:hypothetical protein